MRVKLLKMLYLCPHPYLTPIVLLVCNGCYVTSRRCLKLHNFFQHQNLGFITSLIIGHDNNGVFPNWRLNSITVSNEVTGQVGGVHSTSCASTVTRAAVLPRYESPETTSVVFMSANCNLKLYKH